MKFVDLRSDTVTLPTQSMREAMAKAELGDDVYGEDPTVNRLQELAAKRMGKEAGIFVPTGTMGNLVAVLAHCGRGDEAIMGTMAHTFLSEGGGIAALGGVQPFTVPNQTDGTLSLTDIRNARRSDIDPHHPLSRLVVIENTQNRCGGIPLSLEYTQQVGQLTHELGLKLHLDGARLFNAAAATGVDAKALAEPADSVTFCLSKGLCAPVGSVLCGSEEFITKARRLRKQLGAGMRQVGVLAAAGIVALDEMTERLGEDHKRARDLAAGLVGLPGIHLEWEVPPSNMVFIGLDEKLPATPADLIERMKPYNILIGAFGPRRIRLVTHYWIDDEGVTRTIEAFRKILSTIS